MSLWGLLSYTQHGFTKYRSCQSNLKAFSNIVTEWAEKADTAHIICLSCSEAFDTEPHRKLTMVLTSRVLLDRQEIARYY